MNMTDVATWGQLISSAAVLVTLVYLSIQTRQTATLLRSEARQSIIDADVAILSRITDWPTVFTDWFSEGEIAMENKARLHAFLLMYIRTREYQWIEYENGVLDRATWESYHHGIPIILGTKRNRAWWQTIGRHSPAPAFVEIVDATLEEEVQFDIHQQLLAWK